MIKKIIEYIKRNAPSLLVLAVLLLLKNKEGFGFTPLFIGASGIYNRYKANLMNRVVDMEGDTIYVMLLNNSHSFTATNDVIGDVSANEITGTGYTANGTALAGKAVTQAATTKFDATDVAWTGATFTAYHAVLWDDTVATDDLICSIDFGAAKSVSSGTFTIVWNANGILTLATA